MSAPSDENPSSTRLAYEDSRRRLPTRRTLQLVPEDARLVLAHIMFAFVALLLGGIAGLFQSIVRSGKIDIPFGFGYYQLLTAHGILMALVFTTFFIIGFLLSGLAVTMDGELSAGTRGLAWAGFATMILGCILIIIPVLTGDATVLYTFYAPMQAHPAFYFGLAFVVIGSWLGGAAVMYEYVTWRRRNFVAISPLFAFMAITTMILWQIATLGVAAEVILQLIPWSLGWVDTVDVLLSRTLFWFFGHPLVYFWLLPAYIAWYLVMPKLIGGRVFSDNLARMSFVLLLLFSIPVGLHHQLAEPGIDDSFKLTQVGLTLAVAIPSLMTAFALFATMELAGRARGYGGLFGWFKGLPWRDARFLALFMGMAVFIPGGAGGLILASFNLNQVVHNTIYVTGHFHLTVATASALTFIGTAFWLVPHAAGRRITAAANRLMLVQVYLWVVGMTIMSGAMHIVGFFGAPRRTKWIDYGPNEPLTQDWVPYQFAMAIGGTILFISVLIAVGLVVHLAWRAPRETAEHPRAEYPLADPPRGGMAVPHWLERWRYWLAAVAVLIVAAYSGPIYHMLSDPSPGAPGAKTFEGDEGGSKMIEPVAPAADEPTVESEAPPAAEAGTMVNVELGEDGGDLYLRPDKPSVEAGTVTFEVVNAGALPHEMVVLQTDTPADELPEGDGGKADETGRLAAVPDLTPGSDAMYITLDLEPGDYVLLCNVPGHYSLGQYSAFTVT